METRRHLKLLFYLRETICGRYETTARSPGNANFETIIGRVFEDFHDKLLDAMRVEWYFDFSKFEQRLNHEGWVNAPV